MGDVNSLQARVEQLMIDGRDRSLAEILALLQLPGDRGRVVQNCLRRMRKAGYRVQRDAIPHTPNVYRYTVLPGLPPRRGDARVRNSGQATAQRYEQLREMAKEGYHSTQIAAAVGLSVERVRLVARRQGIRLTADEVTCNARLPNATRIVEHMVMSAEHLCADVGLIDFTRLDPAEIPGWVASLRRSDVALRRFIRLLNDCREKPEAQHDDIAVPEAAQPSRSGGHGEDVWQQQQEHDPDHDPDDCYAPV